MSALRRQGAIHLTHAFTLIEMSIVLVIIALVVGGILFGKDMVENAQVRSQISDIDRLNTSVNAFTLKYACLPGDCRNATQFFSASSQPAQVRNGNGNGNIQGTYDTGGNPFNMPWWPSNNASAEWAEVFDQLSAASLWDILQYDETSVASNAINIAYPPLRFFGGSANVSAGWGAYNERGGMGLGYDIATQHITAGNKIRLGICGGVNAGYPGFGCGITPIYAYRIDSKLDDGQPYSGRVYLGGPTVYAYRLPGTAQDDTGACGVSASNTYKTSTTVNAWLCALIISVNY